MRTDKYLLLKNGNVTSGVANENVTSSSKALISLIVANLACAGLLYLVYLIF